MKIKGVEFKEFIGCVISLVVKYLPCFFYSCIFKRDLSPVWLISERKNDARDNGFVLFKYIRTRHPEKPVFYVIDKKCQDYNKVKEFGNVINWGSLRHYYYCANASLIASTDFGMGYPSPIMRPILLCMKCCGRGKSVFLQHGITKDDLEHAKKHKLQVDMFVCGAKPEYDYILKRFGYNGNELKYIGFARFDTLKDTSVSNQILYMPTWRTWLSFNDFENSTYYKSIVSFLSSDSLRKFLTASQSKLIFFVHPAIRSAKIFFETFASSDIIIANNDDYDLQVLLNSSKLLITDYSSIYFDFAYLNKPVIYFQFDYEEYRMRQYKEGYFDYERNGFGSVINDTKQLVNRIIELHGLGWKNPSFYNSRVEYFFPLRDNRSCERHYKEMEYLVNNSSEM